MRWYIVTLVPSIEVQQGKDCKALDQAAGAPRHRGRSPAHNTAPVAGPRAPGARARPASACQGHAGGDRAGGAGPGVGGGVDAAVLRGGGEGG